jgi:dihydrolipoamide dehydrogenase
MLVREDRLLMGVEPFAGEAVAARLRDVGVDVRFGAQTARVRREGAVTIELTDGTSLEADEILVAAGREPRTGDLGLDTVGLTPGGWLEVDDTCLVTGVPGGWLYAAGDLNHRALLTHMGKYQARACAAAIAERAAGRAAEPGRYLRWTATADLTAVPQVIFAQPEVAAVGLTRRAAEAAGIAVRVLEFDIGKVAGAALYADGYEGHAMLLVDEARSVIVGATFTGSAVGEMLHAATIAVVGEVPLDRLWHAVPSYPTISEVWLRLLDAAH